MDIFGSLQKWVDLGNLNFGRGRLSEFNTVKRLEKGPMVKQRLRSLVM